MFLSTLFPAFISEHMFRLMSEDIEGDSKMRKVSAWMQPQIQFQGCFIYCINCLCDSSGRDTVGWDCIILVLLGNICNVSLLTTIICLLNIQNNIFHMLVQPLRYLPFHHSVYFKSRNQNFLLIHLITICALVLLNRTFGGNPQNLFPPRVIDGWRYTGATGGSLLIIKCTNSEWKEKFPLEQPSYCMNRAGITPGC